MEFKAAKCPECGGSLQLPENMDQAKCMYCGATIVVKRAINLASVAGVNTEHITKLADDAFAALNFTEAYNYYTKLLEFEPNNYNALYGKAMSAGWQSTVANMRLLETIKGVGAAVELVPKEEAAAFKEKAGLAMNNLAVAVESQAFKVFSMHVTPESFTTYFYNLKLIIPLIQIASTYNQNDKQILMNMIEISKRAMVSYSNKISNQPIYTAEATYNEAKSWVLDAQEKIRKKVPNFAADIPTHKTGPCFIATACYGSYDAPEVKVLRQFRDEVLMVSALGRV